MPRSYVRPPPLSSRHKYVVLDCVRRQRRRIAPSLARTLTHSVFEPLRRRESTLSHVHIYLSASTPFSATMVPLLTQTLFPLPSLPPSLSFLQSIGDYATQLFANAGLVSIGSVASHTVRDLAAASGATIIPSTSIVHRSAAAASSELVSMLGSCGSLSELHAGTPDQRYVHLLPR